MPRCDSQNPAHSKIDVVFESPSLFLTSQSTSGASDFVELNESLKEPRVGLGVAQVVTEESGELVKSVQTASSDHVK